MADLTGQQLKDSYQNLLTIDATIESNPTSGQLENGLGNAITALGIGTDSPFFTTSGRASLSLNGTSSSLIAFGKNGSSENYFLADAGGFTIANTSATLPTTFYNNGLNRAQIKSSGDISFRDTSSNEAFYWDASTARLGIGTDSPSNTLSVFSSGASAITIVDVVGGSSGAGVLQLSAGTTLGSASFDIVQNSAGAFINQRDNNPMSFYVNNDEKIRIEADGDIAFYDDANNQGLFWDASTARLGLGTQTPSARLNVAGALGSVIGGGASAIRMTNTDTSSYASISAGIVGVSNSGMDFSVDGTRSMVINGSGNVGIGTDSPDKKLQVNGSGTITRFTDGTSHMDFYSGSGLNEIATVSPLLLSVGGTERLRIDSSGNVLVGKTTSSIASEGVELFPNDRSAFTRDGGYPILVNRLTSDGDLINFRKDGTTVGSIASRGGTTTAFITNPSSGNGAGLTGSTNMLIPSSETGVAVDNRINLGSSSARFKDLYLSGDAYIDGNVLVGTIANPLGGQLHSNASSTNFVLYTSGVNWASINNHTNSGTQYFQDFRYSGTQIGSIIGSNTSTAYSTTSDYRLKENVVEMTGALDRVDQLKPSRFNFIADSNTTVDGFLAHEVADIVPEAITGEKDATEEYEVTPAVLDDDGNIIEEAVMGTRPVYQGIDQSKLVPLLVGAIQELRAEIEQLKNQ
jgi:hypothetical protein